MKKLMFVIASLCLLLALGTPASAALTYINPLGGGTGIEPSLTAVGGILDTLYGLPNLVRVDDTWDMTWYFDGPTGTAEAQAKYAGFSQYLYAGVSKVSKHLLFVVPSGMSGYLSGIPSDTFSADDPGLGPIFHFYDDPNGGSSPLVMSSVSAENAAYAGQPAGLDRMVSWRNKLTGHYIMAWEDRNDLDYNDIVYEFSGIHPVPEPATMSLLGLGILGLFGLKRKRA